MRASLTAKNVPKMLYLCENQPEMSQNPQNSSRWRIHVEKTENGVNMCGSKHQKLMINQWSMTCSEDLPCKTLTAAWFQHPWGMIMILIDWLCLGLLVPRYSHDWSNHDTPIGSTSCSNGGWIIATGSHRCLLPAVLIFLDSLEAAILGARASQDPSWAWIQG